MVQSMINDNLAPPVLHGNTVVHCLKRLRCNAVAPRGLFCSGPQQFAHDNSEACFCTFSISLLVIAGEFLYITQQLKQLILGAILTGMQYLLDFHRSAIEFASRTLRRKACERAECDREMICIVGDQELLNEPCKNSSLKCLCAWLANAKKALLQSYKTLVTSA